MKRRGSKYSSDWIPELEDWEKQFVSFGVFFSPDLQLALLGSGLQTHNKKRTIMYARRGGGQTQTQHVRAADFNSRWTKIFLSCGLAFSLILIS